MRLHFLIAVFVTILIFAPVSHACTCAGMPSGNPACQTYWYWPVIFSGKVVEIRAEGQRLNVKLKVNESFRGISGTTVEITTADDGAACGYPFKLNESYLVYTKPDRDGKLSVGLCGRTIPMSSAADDIAYFKSVPTLNPLGSIGGIVYENRSFKENETHDHLPPLTGLKVTVDGPKGTVETRTDENGKYRFTDLEPGDYTVKLFAPDGFIPQKDEAKLKVIAKGCSFYDAVFSREQPQ